MEKITFSFVTVTSKHQFEDMTKSPAFGISPAHWQSHPLRVPNSFSVSSSRFRTRTVSQSSRSASPRIKYEPSPIIDGRGAVVTDARIGATEIQFFLI